MISLNNNSTKLVLCLIFFLSILLISCTGNSDTGDSSDCKVFKTRPSLGEYYNIALKSELEGNYKSAERYYKESAQYGGIWDNPTIQVYSLASLARVQIYLEKYIEARETIDNTLDLNKELNNFEIECLCYENLGLLNYYKENFPEAEINFINALSNYSKCNIYNSMANLYNNLGLLYIKTENYEEAEKKLLKAARLNSDLNRYGAQSSNFTNLGILYEKTNDFEKAEKVYKLALEIDKREGYFNVIGKDLYNLANLYYNESKFDLAIDYYSRTIIYVKSLTKYTEDYLNKAIVSCDKIIAIAKTRDDKDLEEEYIDKRRWFVEKMKMIGGSIMSDDDSDEEDINNNSGSGDNTMNTTVNENNSDS